MGIFNSIDFNNLPQHFKENDVREEIIKPLLNLLGYSVGDENHQIVREYPITHHRTYYGSTEYRHGKLKIDYLLIVKGKNAFVLEAKAPCENILSGKHVGQAYSYAISMEIRTDRFVLCNGKEISVFFVDRNESVLHFSFGSATKENWERLYDLLSPAAFINPNIFNYKLDYGIWCLRQGVMPDVIQYFYSCYFSDIVRQNDKMYMLLATVIREGQEFLASFNFDSSLFDSFMSQAPVRLKDKVYISLTGQPYEYIRPLA